MLEIKKPLAASGTLTNRGKIAQIYDKGKAAVVILEMRSFDETGAEVLKQEFTVFLRGAGGFGGDKGPAQAKNDPPALVHIIIFHHFCQIFVNYFFELIFCFVWF
jgi:3-hydroxyacyl-CoA dehydrogenase/3a,7a,12a-trihydroxy-5b-cholest-24-enoyl-CoA hydratase